MRSCGINVSQNILFFLTNSVDTDAIRYFIRVRWPINPFTGFKNTSKHATMYPGPAFICILGERGLFSLPGKISCDMIPCIACKTNSNFTLPSFCDKSEIKSLYG